MMLFPGMLIGACEKSGIKVPENVDEYDPEKYPHFYVFCQLQLGRPITWGEHWDNAEIISKLTVEEIKTFTLAEYLSRGLHWAQ
jgi:hypothetical protein